MRPLRKTCPRAGGNNPSPGRGHKGKVSGRSVLGIQLPATDLRSGPQLQSNDTPRPGVALKSDAPKRVHPCLEVQDDGKDREKELKRKRAALADSAIRQPWKTIEAATAAPYSSSFYLLPSQFGLLGGHSGIGPSSA